MLRLKGLIREMSCPAEKELNDSFPEFSTVLSLPVGLITGPGEFWKPKQLSVLVKEGLSSIHRGDNQQDQQR